jgi:cob(I)alamin adenosyltransferase
MRITKVYTRTGDQGSTRLVGGRAVAKNHVRVSAYGSVDELNAIIGIVRTFNRRSGAARDVIDRLDGMLHRIQNDLFDVGADISVPAGGERERLRVIPEQTAWLEQACDEANQPLAPLKSFVLPGGTPAAAQLHVCRTVCRRAERRAIACGDAISPETVRYLNRLSDLLFILSRAANAGSSEPLWEPGRYR